METAEPHTLIAYTHADSIRTMLVLMEYKFINSTVYNSRDVEAT